MRTAILLSGIVIANSINPEQIISFTISISLILVGLYCMFMDIRDDWLKK